MSEILNETITPDSAGLKARIRKVLSLAENTSKSFTLIADPTFPFSEPKMAESLMTMAANATIVKIAAEFLEKNSE